MLLLFVVCGSTIVGRYSIEMFWIYDQVPQTRSYNYFEKSRKIPEVMGLTEKGSSRDDGTTDYSADGSGRWAEALTVNPR